MRETRALVRMYYFDIKNILQNDDWGIKALDVYFIMFV
jgi:hypothetical protein